ncbi:MAG: hypothetical protein JW837_11470 [Sedimentisphaerales bacterium]|nr:hypothetical protein [Sedimentisphaerales bacterium]
MVNTGTRNFRTFCLLLPSSIALSGLAVLGYQSFFWLKLGYWKPIASKLLLNEILPINFFQWLHSPYSWIGLKKLIFPVFNIPLALFLLLVGLITLLLVSRIFSLFIKPEKIKVPDSRRWRTS